VNGIDRDGLRALLQLIDALPPCTDPTCPVHGEQAEVHTLYVADAARARWLVVRSGPKAALVEAARDSDRGSYGRGKLPPRWVVLPGKPAPGESWAIFYEDGERWVRASLDVLYPGRDIAEHFARESDKSFTRLGMSAPTWRAERIDERLADPRDEKIASLEARVATLVQSEARAVAGEKEARDALARAGETIAELTARYAAPKVEA